MKSSVNSVYRKNKNILRICQGDLLEDLVYPEWSYREENKLKINRRTIPYLFVLTQDCDLESDQRNHGSDSEKQDAYLQSILVCPAYPGEKFKEGEHLEKLDLKMEYQNSKKWSVIKKLNDPRYHYIPNDDEYNLTDLVVDFKHYYTIPRNALYNLFITHYKVSLNELFRESLSQRFTSYLSRVGLPEINCE